MFLEATSFLIIISRIAIQHQSDQFSSIFWWVLMWKNFGDFLKRPKTTIKSENWIAEYNSFYLFSVFSWWNASTISKAELTFVDTLFKLKYWINWCKNSNIVGKSLEIQTQPFLVFTNIKWTFLASHIWFLSEIPLLELEEQFISLAAVLKTTFTHVTFLVKLFWEGEMEKRNFQNTAALTLIVHNRWMTLPHRKSFDWVPFVGFGRWSKNVL